MLLHSAKLVHSTTDAEHLITKMARVSNPSNENNHQTAPKLLRYLIKHKHWSPFEMASMCVEIYTTRAIAAQILRHRSFSFQEFSQRYADVDNLSFAKPVHLRQQDTKNRQNSTDTLPRELLAEFAVEQQNLFTQAEKLYRSMIDHGVAKECARSILPLATPTRMYMHGTLRSWIHYFDVRCDPATQIEHRQVATSARGVFESLFPSIHKAIYDNDHQ